MSASAFANALANSPNIDPRTFKVLSGIEADTITSDFLGYGLSVLTFPALLAVGVGLVGLILGVFSCVNHCRCCKCPCETCRPQLISPTTPSVGYVYSHAVNTMLVCTVLSAIAVFLAFVGWMLLTAEAGQFSGLVQQMKDYQSDLLLKTREGGEMINAVVASLAVVRSSTPTNYSSVIGVSIQTANHSLLEAGDRLIQVRDAVDIDIHLDTAITWSRNLRLWIGLAGGGVLCLFVLFVFISAIDTLGQTIVGPCGSDGRWMVSVKPINRCSYCWNATSVVIWSAFLIPVSIGMVVAFYALSEALAETCRIGPYQIMSDFLTPPPEVAYYFDTCNSTSESPFNHDLLLATDHVVLADRGIREVLNISLEYNLTDTANSTSDTLALLLQVFDLIDETHELTACSSLQTIKDNALASLCVRLPNFLFMVFVAVLSSIPLIGALYLSIALRPSQPRILRIESVYAAEAQAETNASETQRLFEGVRRVRSSNFTFAQSRRFGDRGWG